MFVAQVNFTNVPATKSQQEQEQTTRNRNVFRENVVVMREGKPPTRSQQLTSDCITHSHQNATMAQCFMRFMTKSPENSRIYFLFALSTYTSTMHYAQIIRIW